MCFPKPDGNSGTSCPMAWKLRWSNIAQHVSRSQGSLFIWCLEDAITIEQKINCSAPRIDAVDGDALPRSRRPLLRQRLSGEQCWLVFGWTPVWQKAGVSVGTLGFTMEMFVKQESPEEINTKQMIMKLLNSLYKLK